MNRQNAMVYVTQSRFNIQATNPTIGMLAARYTLVQDKDIETIILDEDSIEMRYNPVWALTTPDLSKKIEEAVDLHTQGLSVRDTVDAAIIKTHTLSVVYRARNGKRSTVNYPITTAEATDPLTRAAVISRAAAMGDMVNWTITEGVPA